MDLRTYTVNGMTCDHCVAAAVAEAGHEVAA
jgi:hypothetical protein